MFPLFDYRAASDTLMLLATFTHEFLCEHVFLVLSGTHVFRHGVARTYGNSLFNF